MFEPRAPASEQKGAYNAVRAVSGPPTSSGAAARPATRLGRRVRDVAFRLRNLGLKATCTAMPPTFLISTRA